MVYGLALFDSRLTNRRPRASLFAPDFPSWVADGALVAFRALRHRHLPGGLAVGPHRVFRGTISWGDLSGSSKAVNGFSLNFSARTQALSVCVDVAHLVPSRLSGVDFGPCVRGL